MIAPRTATIALIALLSAAPLFAAEEAIPKHRLKEIVAAAPGEPAAKPKETRRVLIFNTPPHLMPKDPHRGYCIPYGTAAFRVLGEKSGAYQPVVSDDLAMLLPERIGDFDAIVLNNTCHAWTQPTDEQMTRPAFRKLAADKQAAEKAIREGFIDYVRDGGGLVVVHFGIALARKWPAFAEMVGATFTGHPWNEEIGVTVEEPDHPLTAAFDGRRFRIADEIYQYGKQYSREKVRVLLSLDPARTNMGVRWIHRKDNDFALAWVRSFDKGRIFNCSFGHRSQIYSDPRILRMYLDAIQFAAGDLDAPAAPRPGTPKHDIPGTEPAPGREGFVSLFNGRDLAGWTSTGDANVWSVRDGAITGVSKAGSLVKENTFLVWKDEIENFELFAKFRLVGGNSGIYYRAARRRPGRKGEALVGPQADFSADHRWTGEIMEYKLRGELAKCGQDVTIDADGKRTVKSLAEPKDLLSGIDLTEWNEYHILADGGTVTLAINGRTMCKLEDNDPKRPKRGWLGLQVHRGPAMTVQFKDIHLKRLPPSK